MKALWIVLGVLAACCLVCCGGAIFFGRGFVEKGMAAYKDAQAYADESIRAIAKTWDVNELEKRASPEFKGEEPHHAMAGRMEDCKERLGSLESVGKTESFSFNTGATTSEGAYQQVTMRIRAEFEKGPAEITITVAKAPAGWQINQFRVN